MKKIFLVLFLLHSVISYAECPTQTVCKSGTCFQEEIPFCGNNERVIVNSPNSNEIDSKTWNTQNQNTNFTHQNEITQNSLPVQKQTPVLTSCTENGSCYGDISNINGLPKTTHIRGYYRKDGTYVRGHYRSKGR